MTGFVQKYVDHIGPTVGEAFQRIFVKFTTITCRIFRQLEIETEILFEGDSPGTILGVTAKPPYDLPGRRRVVYFLCYIP